ncbi:restriction endonuclease [Cohnella soli]|uniref:Restriction endonuclease n=1 Tax=Cohnella soli TaxID=425005 RepID=A0ABW0HXZ8_9BACL
MKGILIAIIAATILIIIIVRNKIVTKHKEGHQVSSVYDDIRTVSITDIDRMEDGSEFEMYLYRLFLELGYQGVYKTIGARDFGADIVFTDREDIRNVVQAKRYTDSVGISAVQEVFSSMRYYKARKAIVIASAKFTEPCETLAGVNHVKLLDRDDLIYMIEAFKKDDIQAVKDKVEAEPRMILESWSEVNNTILHEIRKDYKAESDVQKMKEV